MIRPEYYGKYGELEAARYLQKQGYKNLSLIHI